MKIEIKDEVYFPLSLVKKRAIFELNAHLNATSIKQQTNLYFAT